MEPIERADIPVELRLKPKGPGPREGKVELDPKTKTPHEEGP